MLPVPIKITALKGLMHLASAWFDGWHSDVFKNSSPELLTADRNQKLFVNCKDWARKKRLDHDTKDSSAMEICGAKGEDNSPQEQQYDWSQIGYVDEDCNWWSEADWNNGYANTPGYEANEYEVNAVNTGKGKGKGKGPQCYKCWKWTHCA